MMENRKCTGCTSCANICPKQCITMQEDIEGFLYPVIDKSKCINCNLCEKVCPITTPQKKSTSTYSICVQNKDESIREVSTAGGVVGAVFTEIFCNNGIAYGAALDKKQLPYHVKLKSIENCFEKNVFGSKYVSSWLGNTFSEIKQLLDENIEVCFVGLPCQVAGLKSFLQKEYENLLTIDLTCYGVPSTKLYREYIEYIEKKFGAKIKQVSFRDKLFGYASPSMSVQFVNGKKISQNSSVKTFLRSFFKNISIRPSCYECVFKGIERVSDMTIGDCKSIGKFIPEMDDDKGTTVVYVHTEKGRKIIERISDRLIVNYVDLDSVIKISGKKMIESPAVPQQRTQFFLDMQTMKYEQLIEKYCPADWSEKLANLIKTIVLACGLNKSGIMKQIKKWEKRSS